MMPDFSLMTREELVALVLASCLQLTVRFPDVPCGDVRDAADRELQERA